LPLAAGYHYLFRVARFGSRVENQTNPKSAIPARHRPPEADSGEASGPNPKSDEFQIHKPDIIRE